MPDIRNIFETHKISKRTVMERVPIIEEEEVNGKIMKRIRGFEDRERVVKDGYMVYFPRGHSVFVEKEQMPLFNLADKNGNIYSGRVDMETGDLIENQDNGSLKDMIERRAASAKPVTLDDLVDQT